MNLDCPLCGGLRAVNSLMRGDFLAAADHNVFVVVGVPIVAVTWIVWILSSALGRPFTLPKVPNWLIGALLLQCSCRTVVPNVGGPTWATWSPQASTADTTLRTDSHGAELTPTAVIPGWPDFGAGARVSRQVRRVILECWISRY